MPLAKHGIRPKNSWKIEFRSPERDVSVTIRTKYDDRQHLKRVKKRQFLESLEEQPSNIPKRDERTSWFRPGVIRIDRKIGMYDWHSNDTLEIRQKSEEEFEMRPQFRHDTLFKFVDRGSGVVVGRGKPWCSPRFGSRSAQLGFSIMATQALEPQFS
jgi:hypothetical protein